ncbi:DUF4476 domain-containing protein [Archangium sp.]|uniref:DUF4476 domain-containing protein n=1 Tax=Archangium sp. TaxID=1872627 RepID=UPI002D3D6A21|nr:DUF4476 domain-containing protein [Archangium sp.]HYO55569.1 DUF4476 domain-containing protein [Archangium sp.]
MRAVLIAVAALLAVPALAQSSSTDVQPPTQAVAIRPPPGTPNTPSTPAASSVVVDRDELMRQLASINEKLAQASGRAKKDKQLQKVLDDARAELKEVGRQVSSAPPARMEPPREPPRAPPPPQPTVQPITEAMLRSLVAAIRNEPFADDQLAVLEEAVPTQYFLVSQAQQILRHFNMSKDRLKAMRLLRPRLVDMENSFKLYEAFEFSNDKDELKRILASPTP